MPTLTSVHQSSTAGTSQQSADLYKSDKEQFNKDTKSDELGEEGDNSLLNQVRFFNIKKKQSYFNPMLAAVRTV